MPGQALHPPPQPLCSPMSSQALKLRLPLLAPIADPLLGVVVRTKSINPRASASQTSSAPQYHRLAQVGDGLIGAMVHFIAQSRFLKISKGDAAVSTA
jgi:hypothetical protein